jgi:hypothetical protein
VHGCTDVEQGDDPAQSDIAASDHGDVFAS